MTTQELYTKLISGDITEQKFLYETRRDSRLPFITKFNSFKDTVQILKNKGIISEKAAKESAGKQEVEIISKTIDMVNPYEYSRGMDYELGIVIDAAGNADLDEEKIEKAQKIVLKNLTNNPGYYSQKLIPQTEGESEYEVEVNAKSIEALKKKQGKIIREHGENYDKVADVDPDISQLEEEPISYDNLIGSIARRLGDLKKYVSQKEPGAIEDFQNVMRAFEIFDEKMAYGTHMELEEHGQYADRVADVNADSSPLNEDNIEELGKTRDSIYEKYASKYGVDVNELKDRLEAYKLEKEGVTYAGKDSVDDLKKDPKFSTLSQSGKEDAEVKLRQGGTVSVG